MYVIQAAIASLQWKPEYRDNQPFHTYLSTFLDHTMVLSVQMNHNTRFICKKLTSISEEEEREDNVFSNHFKHPEVGCVVDRYVVPTASRRRRVDVQGADRGDLVSSMGFMLYSRTKGDRKLSKGPSLYFLLHMPANQGIEAALDPNKKEKKPGQVEHAFPTLDTLYTFIFDLCCHTPAGEGFLEIPFPLYMARELALFLKRQDILPPYSENYPELDLRPIRAGRSSVY